MLQFYFLSVSANFLAGLALSAEWFSRKIPGLAGLAPGFSGRGFRMGIGLAAIFVGIGTLFVPADPRVVLGDLLPSFAGMAMGIAMLFEVFRQDAIFPAERGEKADRSARLPMAYRTALGIFGLAVAIVHFFLPERLIV
jgi:hypothetical protein